MVQWNFYFSGILYGEIFPAEDQVYVRSLAPETGKLGEKKVFDKETDQFFQELCGRSLLSFFAGQEEYEQLASENPKEFTTEKGEVFSLRRTGEYIQRYQKFPKDLFFQDGKIYAVMMSGRDTCGILVRKQKEFLTPLAEWEALYPSLSENGVQSGTVYSVKFLGTFQVPTRDGETLATDVYLPGELEGTPVPAVLVRTPYGKKRGVSVYYRFVQRGYAVVVQDTRGREESTGEWLPEYYEVEDGDDTLNWIAAREWSDGQVAMTGGSYLGYVQWAAAASGNPHLKAMLSSVCAGSAFVDIPRRGGCFNSGMLAWAFAMSEKTMKTELMVQDWDHILDIRPLETLAEEALGHPVSFLSKWLEHRDLDELWKRSSWKDRYQGSPVPALIMSGWFDDNGMGTTEALELVRDWPQGTWKAVLGPWKHSGNADYDLHGTYVGDDALRYDMDLLCMKWLEHFLKGRDTGIEKTAAVEYYTLGENQWKQAQVWPPEGTEEQIFYLDGDCDDAGVGTGREQGKGILSLECPGSSGQDSYQYDPDNPSTHIIDVSENELETPEDYTEEEKRRDILCFTTPAFERPVTITGDVTVKLFVSCDCPDTDLVVRITDVDENGRSVKLADGVLGCKYRNGFEKPEYMEVGKIYEVSVRTTKISNTFRSGHKMRLTITSSAKNFIFPNSNTELGFDSPEKRIANVTVHRGKEYPSSVCVRLEG